MTGFLLYDEWEKVKTLVNHINMDHGPLLPDNLKNNAAEDSPALIIQWENPYLSQRETAAHVLNTAEAIQNSLDNSLAQKMLNINGIPVYHQSKGTTIRRYFVLAFQQQIIGLYRSRGKKVWLNPTVHPSTMDKFYEITTKTNLREIKRVIRYAVRSIYSLGLDFGGVLLGVTLSGNVKVLHVTAAPKLTETISEKFANMFNQYEKTYIQQYMGGNRESAVLGADPEFVLRHAESGEIILASKYFRKTGMVGCDSIWLREDRTRNQHPLAELRPKPDENPRQLVINIYKAMLHGVKKINEPTIQWLAGGMPLHGYPIGGHIHFSHVWLNSHLLRSLDNYLALPLILAESKESIQRRPRYGYLGDVRTQFHGGFEYRTLPSWLTSPRLTKGVISMAKLLSCCYLSLNYFPLMNVEVQEAFYRGDKEKLKPLAEELICIIKNMDDYENYASYIDPFFEHILSGQEWNEHQDIRAAWKLPPYHKLTKHL